MEPDAVASGRHVEAWSVVAHVEVELVCVGVQPDRDVRVRPRVFEGVLDGLHAAVVHRSLDLWREPIGAGIEDRDPVRVASGEQLESASEPPAAEGLRVEAVRDLAQLRECFLDLRAGVGEPRAELRMAVGRSPANDSLIDAATSRCCAPS